MAIKQIDRKYCSYSDAYKCDFICDSDADVENLPSSACGSTALVIESGSVYVVNASGIWAPMGG